MSAIAVIEPEAISFDVILPAGSCEVDRYDLGDNPRDGLCEKLRAAGFPITNTLRDAGFPLRGDPDLARALKLCGAKSLHIDRLPDSFYKVRFSWQ